ncbi:Uncharacterized conserved protein UCP014543 [Cinnamomum micranthum f. kanehirae]|uniref:Uncharacterized conserved protein UCP014543 n=1 Tax=Cinnamomum micranthum f. kanehirae TaxID=337451 RepID=A0A443P8V6_9MAGN|nr:Uncharacterized conserved protein UCP014543 [Cinnamomum micranthum f. kanehirae]
MGSFCLTFQISSFSSHASCCLSPCCFSTTSIAMDTLSVRQNSTFSTAKAYRSLKLKRLFRSSAEGISNALIEDSKFVPLSADDPKFGPPALLLMGFEKEETFKIQKLLRELDGEFLKVIHCTEDMINRSLWEAVHTPQTNLEDVKIAESLPRICFMSGLTGEEEMMFIDALTETGLQPAVFAALVPNSANKLLAEVMEEIMGDHEMMSASQPGPS